MHYQLLIYRRTRNLGDAVQTIAASRLLSGRLTGVFRDAAHGASERHPFVVNGWLDGPTPAPTVRCVFAGIYLGNRKDEQIGWVRRYPGAIGSRDPFTADDMAVRGIRSDMIGCATLTFERYRGPRAGRYCVDATPPSTGFGLLSNTVPHDLPWPEQWAWGVARLETLRTAALVVTSRLHVALPCLAFGTPVLIRLHEKAATYQPTKLSLLGALGVPGNEVVTADVTAAAARYMGWLSDRPGHTVAISEARCPLPD